jgi:hypothetical protein
MSRPATPGVLVGRGVDGLLVGWLATIVWVAVFAAGRLGMGYGVPGLTTIYWVGAVVTAAHFGLSYHLAYSGGFASVRARPVALAIGPIVLLATLGVAGVAALRSGEHAELRTIGLLITAVYLLTTWHYVKQVYGVGRVGAAFAKIRLSSREAKVLRYGLYPLWFLGAAQVLARGGHYSFDGYAVGLSLLPPGGYHVLRLLAICSGVPLAVVFVGIAVRTRKLPPSAMLAPYIAAYLWLALPTNLVLTLLLLAPFHALQYLAVGHRATLAVAAGRPGHHGVGWWLNVFGGAACGGLLVSRWLPQTLDARFTSGHGPALFTAAAFVFLNLHHYLIDASIWRSKGELVKAVVAGATPGAARAHPAVRPAVAMGWRTAGHLKPTP